MEHVTSVAPSWHSAATPSCGAESRKPYDAISYCYVGAARSNMGRSLLVMGAIMGVDVRSCSPRDLWPPDEVRQIADEHTIKAVLVATLGAG